MTRSTINYASLTNFALDLDSAAKKAAKSVVEALDDFIRSDDPLPRHIPHAFREVTALSSDARTLRVIAARYLFDSSRPTDEVADPHAV